METTTDVISLLTANNELLAQNNAILLFMLGCTVAVFVCVLLYKFLKIFI